MIKKTVISAATIVMPRAHRKELTGLKALKGIGRRPLKEALTDGDDRFD